MANWSDTKISIQGTKKSITEFVKRVDHQVDGELVNDCYLFIAGNPVLNTGGGMEINSIDVTETSVEIGGSGRWCAPSWWFVAQVEELGLSMEYVDAEPGCDFFHKMVYIDGGYESDETQSYMCKLRYEDDEVGCLQQIQDDIEERAMEWSSDSATQQEDVNDYLADIVELTECILAKSGDTMDVFYTEKVKEFMKANW